MADKSYLERTKDSIAVQCKARGIMPDDKSEMAGVAKLIQAKAKKPMEEMTDRELTALNRALPFILTEYLGGKKRR